jgi:hypothetical protein
LHDGVLVEPGWLDGLLAALTLDAGVVTPAQQAWDDDRTYLGPVFDPDDSGLHLPLTGPTTSPLPIASFCNPVLLLDRAKCRPLSFDENYRHYFYDLDFGLRVWEAGLHVVCTPAARVRLLTAAPLPHGPLIHPVPFEEDRRRFVRRWMESGRFERLRLGVWSEIPALQAVGQSSAEPQEETSPGPLGQAMRLWRRARACVRHRGPRALLGAVGRRLLAMLSRT